jgi:hypothetical protein
MEHRSLPCRLAAPNPAMRQKAEQSEGWCSKWFTKTNLTQRRQGTARRSRNQTETPSTQRRRGRREPPSFFFNHGWTRRKAAWQRRHVRVQPFYVGPRRYTRINLTRLAPQPQILDCGGKRSATPLLEATGSTESGVAAALCHRSPNLCRPCAKLQNCITDKGETRIS